MPRTRAALKLFREFVGFARENRAWWLVPLMLLLGLVAIVIVAGETVTPLLYTLI